MATLEIDVTQWTGGMHDPILGPTILRGEQAEYWEKLCAEMGGASNQVFIILVQTGGLYGKFPPQDHMDTLGSHPCNLPH